MKTPEAVALDLVAKGAILKTFETPRRISAPIARLTRVTNQPAEDGGLRRAVQNTYGGPDLRHFLVGDFRWVAPDAFFWFTAHGDSIDDGHVLAFDRAVASSNGSVIFQLQQRPVAELSPIDVADVADADDYRVAFSFWKETGPVIRPLIDRCFDRCAAAATTASMPPIAADEPAIIAS